VLPHTRSKSKLSEFVFTPPNELAIKRGHQDKAIPSTNVANSESFDRIDASKDAPLACSSEFVVLVLSATGHTSVAENTKRLLG
jgi:hypothetical protein